MNVQEATVILTGQKVGRWMVGELVDGPNCNQCGEPIKMELKVLRVEYLGQDWSPWGTRARRLSGYSSEYGATLRFHLTCCFGTRWSRRDFARLTFKANRKEARMP